MEKLFTDDFSEFRKKVESSFGCELEILAKDYPDIYAHQVLSHGFMEYLWAKGPQDEIKARIRKEKGSFDCTNSEDNKIFEQYLKEEFLAWARQNKLEESILEEGWKEYLED